MPVRRRIFSFFRFFVPRCAGTGPGYITLAAAGRSPAIRQLSRCSWYLVGVDLGMCLLQLGRKPPGLDAITTSFLLSPTKLYLC